MTHKKIGVGILGATGSVGQRFVQLLTHHPLFEITALAASERSQGKPYGEAVNWLLQTPLSPAIAALHLRPCQPDLPCEIVFSGLDSLVAGTIEAQFMEAGYIVHSNARNYRMQENVPLLVAEVNPDHLALLNSQTTSGKIITNPNCSTIGLSLAIKPLLDRFGIEALHVVTLQAISGAGYPGIASLDILDNVVPFIDKEEEKMETESLKILGKLQNNRIAPETFRMSAQCNRVSVSDGHIECVSVKFRTKATEKEVIRCWEEFSGKPQEFRLPSAPLHPIHYFYEKQYPQPKLHRELDKGMAVSVGRLRPCPLFDYKFVILSHNTIRGAAGGAILNAELCHRLEHVVNCSWSL
jgi:aspartate-semialdehyde dehydrogenase